MSYVRAEQIATAIRFKEYLLTRDVRSRAVVIDFFIAWALQQGGMPEILAWFRNLKEINDRPDAKERKEQIKEDAYWDELLLAHSHDSDFLQMISMFTA
jgi:hypothetical protein